MESLREAQKRFDELMRSLKANEFVYQPKPDKPIDWTAYSEAKVDELRFMLKLIRQTVDSVDLPENLAGAGRPAIEAKNLAKAVLLQQYLQVNDRTAAGWLDMLSHKLGIPEDFSWRSLARAYEREDVKYVLERTFEKTTQPVAGIAHSFSTDSSGLEESRKQNYENDAHTKKASAYLKLTDTISNEFHVVTSYSLSRNRNDCAVFGEAFAFTAQTQDVQRVDLDAGFVSRDICTMVAENGGTPFIYPKTGLTLKKRGSQAWKDMLLSFVRNPHEWLEFYHERSNVECWHSAFKRRFAKPLQCKSDETKAVEVCARITIENMTQLCVAHHERRLSIAG